MVEEEDTKLLGQKVTEHQLKGEYELAIELQRKRMGLIERTYGKEDPRIAINLARLASLLEASKDKPKNKIEAMYNRALKIYRKCRRTARQYANGRSEGEDPSMKFDDDGREIRWSADYFDRAIAEVLSSLATIIGSDPARIVEANAIHRTSLNMVSTILNTKKDGRVCEYRHLISLDDLSEDEGPSPDRDGCDRLRRSKTSKGKEQGMSNNSKDDVDGAAGYLSWKAFRALEKSQRTLGDPVSGQEGTPGRSARLGSSTL